MRDWGLTVNTEKTKGMVVGASVSEKDMAPLQMESGSIEMVDTFPYLRSSKASDSEITSEV